MPQFFEKDPQETLDYTIDWQAELDDIGSPSDTISTSVWSVPANITNAGAQIDGPKTVILLSGGVDGETYRIANTITTAEAKVFEKSIVVAVINKGSDTYTTALIVEDGTIVANANAYATRSFCSTYHATRSNDDWFNTTPGEQDAAIIKATAYLVQKYRLKWRGNKIQRAQSLDWPRAWVKVEDFDDPDETTPPNSIFSTLLDFEPDDEVPLEVQEATAELALRSLTTTLNPDIEGTGGIKSFKAGSVAVEFSDTSAATKDATVFQIVEDMLRPFLKPASNQLIRG